MRGSNFSVWEHSTRCSFGSRFRTVCDFAKCAGDDLKLRRAANVGIAGEGDVGRLARLVASKLHFRALPPTACAFARELFASPWICFDRSELSTVAMACFLWRLRKPCANFWKTLSHFPAPPIGSSPAAWQFVAGVGVVVAWGVGL